MTPDEIAALATGIVLALAGALVAWGHRLRVAPELAVLAAVAAAWALGLLPSDPGMEGLWSDLVLADPAHARLLALAVLAALIGVRDPARGGRTAIAGIGALTVGALPTALLVVPAARSPHEAARLALFATAVGALSPFGGPGPLLLGNADPGYTLWALPPALVAAALAWPGADPRPGRPTLLGIAGLAGIVVAFVRGPFSGLQVAVLLGVLALLPLPGRPASPDEALPSPDAARVWLPARAAVAAVVLVTLAQIGGALAYLGRIVEPALQLGGGPALTLLAAAATGSVVDPAFVALAAHRTLDITVATPEATSRLVALGLAFAPGLPLAVAVGAHGWPSLRQGVPIALAQLAVAAAWALTG